MWGRVPAAHLRWFLSASVRPGHRELGYIKTSGSRTRAPPAFGPCDSARCRRYASIRFCIRFLGTRTMRRRRTRVVGWRKRKRRMKGRMRGVVGLATSWRMTTRKRRNSVCDSFIHSLGMRILMLALVLFALPFFYPLDKLIDTSRCASYRRRYAPTRRRPPSWALTPASPRKHDVVLRPHGSRVSRYIPVRRAHPHHELLVRRRRAGRQRRGTWDARQQSRRAQDGVVHPPPTERVHLVSLELHSEPERAREGGGQS
ncbi:hypothetical protein R3P38DRAFT_1708896 [Favolaschia claudopus]|uniref:Uncharacterized protein n=1 Tax=Favolaschia claudopus TaxID=2862362 RepID=A0AAW0ABB9_9AGAR